jgi:hypothetical protein
MHAQVQDIEPKALQYVLLDLPGLLFFTTYTLLVLFWAEIYHQVGPCGGQATGCAHSCVTATL